MLMLGVTFSNDLMKDLMYDGVCMKIGPTYVVPFRRRREFVTNYRKRLAALKSGLPRIVVRKSTRSVTVQFVVFQTDGDKVLVSVNSNELKKYGWSPRANLPTAYLTGMLCALKAKKLISGKSILDIGLSTATKGSFAFAALKGVLDSGMEVSHNYEFDEERIKGTHIATYASQLKNKQEQYKRQFGNYLKEGVEPENIVEIFENVKNKLLQEIKQ